VLVVWLEAPTPVCAPHSRPPCCATAAQRARR
jgi:hypothetical protein